MSEDNRLVPQNNGISFSSSPTTEKIDTAFAKAQAEFQVAVHDSKNPHFKSTFASLTSVWSAVRAGLAKHECHVMQWPLDPIGKHIRVLSRVSHKGEYYQSVMSLPVTQESPQGHGSSYTYLRRYALLAILGLADDDDDGESAMGRGKVPAKTPVIRPSPQKQNDVFPEEPPAFEGIDPAFFDRSEDTDDIGEYEIKAGKNKGKRLKEMSIKQLEGFLEWAKEQDSLHPSVAEYAEKAREYLLVHG